MNLQTRLFPWVTLALIIAIIFLIWGWFENGNTKDTFQRDREIIIANAEKAKVKADSIRASERHFRDSTHKASAALKSLYTSKTTQRQAGLKELRALRIALGIKPDTVTVKIEGKMTSQRNADSLEIVRLEQKIFSDSSSFEKEITATNDKYLQQVVISDQHLEHVTELKTDLKKERKRKTGWKILAVIGFGLFAYETIKD
jgi:hypothetical protein